MSKLTARGVNTLKPANRPYRRSDGKGLFIDVRPNGSKYWRMAYRYQGKQKLLALGVYPDTSLEDARGKRDKARQELARGIDPIVSRKAAKAQEKNSFELVAREWINNNDLWSEGHRSKVVRSLERDAFPGIGSR